MKAVDEVCDAARAKYRQVLAAVLESPQTAPDVRWSRGLKPPTTKEFEKDRDGAATWVSSWRRIELEGYLVSPVIKQLGSWGSERLPKTLCLEGMAELARFSGMEAQWN